MIIKLPNICGDNIHWVQIEDDLSMTIMDHDWFDETLVDLGMKKPACLVDRDNWNEHIKEIDIRQRKAHPCQAFLDAIFSSMNSISIPPKLLFMFVIKSLAHSSGIIFVETPYKDLVALIALTENDMESNFPDFDKQNMLEAKSLISRLLLRVPQKDLLTHVPVMNGFLSFANIQDHAWYKQLLRDNYFLSNMSKVIWGSVSSLSSYRIRHREHKTGLVKYKDTEAINTETCEEILGILRQVIETTSL